MAQLVSQLTRQTIKNLSCVNTIKYLSCQKKSTAHVYARTIATTSMLADRWYTDKHEWIELNDDIGTVGISNYAQDALGDVVYAQLPDVGTTIKKEEEVGALESVKAASEIISPITGKVIEKNTLVENKPGLINTSPYKDGWLFKVKVDDVNEIKSLMNEESYEEFLKSDPH
ncbi:GSCOCG00004107001-RA-CDS [Cotesia congregata]|uniref:Glycine cleavage system H protein n=1 Tax=Cotesia congregata TaxID=51543 RepID=A0A8J2H7N9_COTCN|nr:GSCOCG00004107001-RA-CDS [Cotesia congregata]CAG5082312.1 Similar to Gcsh: Glycine cleavage system H protein [Cotesia congregata]